MKKTKWGVYFLKNLSVGVKILLIVVPLIIALSVSTIVGVFQMRRIDNEDTNVYYDTLFKITDLVVNADRDFYQALSAHQDFAYKKDISADDKSALLADVDENMQQTYDRVHEASDIAAMQSSLYSATISDAVFSDLVSKFDESFEKTKAEILKSDGSTDETALSESFEAARDNLDKMGEVVDEWAKQENEKLSVSMTTTTIILVSVFGALIVLLIIFSIYVIRAISKGLASATTGIRALSAGNLNVYIDASKAGNDEVGEITKATKGLADHLKDIISKTMSVVSNLADSGVNLADSSSQASQASGQVSEAVNDVSDGAVSQSESVQDASNRTNTMSEDILNINETIRTLNEYSNSMKDSCDTTMNTLNGLIRSNEQVSKAVKDVGDTINATNESVQNIAKFSDAIMDIASQTNLLSLNASIEAARAGESGKGFAVVADEIRQLADQSRESADEIKFIIDKLSADTEASLAVMEELNKSIELQGDQISTTKSDMSHMNEGVDQVFNSADDISARVDALNDAKQALEGIIHELSAISEENAASSEETSASMEELSATFVNISSAAEQLKQLSTSLEETISYFKV